MKRGKVQVQALFSRWLGGRKRMDILGGTGVQQSKWPVTGSNRTRLIPHALGNEGFKKKGGNKEEGGGKNEEENWGRVY